MVGGIGGCRIIPPPWCRRHPGRLMTTGIRSIGRQQVDLVAPSTEVRCWGVTSRRALTSASSEGVQCPHGVMESATSIVGVVAGTAGRPWWPRCSVVGVACGETDLHGGG
jgi:hypothetical protein